MPYAELMEWQDFYAIEPWGLSTQDAAQAHIASIIANTVRDSRQRPAPYKLSEFLLYQDQPADVGPILLENSDEQTEAMIAAMFGGLNVIRS